MQATPQSFIRNHAVVLLAFAIPVLFILGVVIFLHVPVKSISTDYDFLYATCSDDYYSYECSKFVQNYFSVSDDKVILSVDTTADWNRNNVPDVNEGYKVHLFFHDTQKNESKEVTLEDIQQMSVTSSITSPDGVAVQGSYNQGPEFFPFFSNGSNFGYYLVKGNKRAPLTLVLGDNMYAYQEGFEFVGWVTR